ncbi:MAG: PAS domain S-box protein [Rhodoferax sp.]|uniref:PAS domain S-box protein n=1 Tax=Rhodoferax sp. TaxID=50421 RepID=UPI0030166AA6
MRIQLRQSQSIAVLAALSIAAVVLTVSFLIWGLRERELEHARIESTAIAQMLMEQTEQSFEAADLVLRGVQERISNEYGRQFALDSAATHLLLTARASGMRQITSIFLVDAQGTVLNSSLDYPMPKISVVDREYFQYFAQTGSKKFFISKPMRNRINSSWSMYMARPLFEANGKFRGIVVCAIGVLQLEEMYQLMKLDYERPLALYLEDGTLIASVPHRESKLGNDAPELLNEKLPVKPNDIRTIQHHGADGEHEMFSLGRLKKFPLLVSVTDDVNLSLESWRETVTPIAVGALLVCIFTASIALFLNRKLKAKEALTAALRTANDLYQHTVNSVMDAIVAIDSSQQIVLFNPAAEKMFDLKAEEIIGKPFNLLIPERARAKHVGHVDRFSESSVNSRTMAPQLEITGRRADGTEFPIESTISKSIIGGKMQLTAVLRDVTEHRQSETELREVNRQLRSLSTSLQLVREEERTRIARELHDDLGQQLTGLKLSMSWLGNRIKDGRTTTPDTIDEMRMQLETAIASVRRLSTELRPLILDDLGFAEAVSFQTREFTKRSQLEVSLNLDAADLVEDDILATALFRIVQESLTNVARHAHASQVAVNFTTQGDNLVLTVTDDGQGMPAATRQGGIGLVSMRERAISIGAQFNIISDPGAGTTIKVTVALHTQALEPETA